MANFNSNGILTNLDVTNIIPNSCLYVDSTKSITSKTSYNIVNEVFNKRIITLLGITTLSYPIPSSKVTIPKNDYIRFQIEENIKNFFNVPSNINLYSILLMAHVPKVNITQITNAYNENSYEPNLVVLSMSASSIVNDLGEMDIDLPTNFRHNIVIHNISNEDFSVLNRGVSLKFLVFRKL